jgi:tight adherence protein C
MALAFVTFVTVFVSISIFGTLVFNRQKTVRRLSQVTAPPADAVLLRTIAQPAGDRVEKLLKPFHKVLPRSPEDVSAIQKRLGRAGYREKSYVNIFYSSRVALPAALCVLCTITGIYEYAPFFVYAIAAGLGFLAPDYWLSNRTSARQRKLRLGLPEALDLIVICVEAGLSMDKATMRTSEELQLSQPAIADELHLVYLEQRAGCSRTDAWKHLAERTGVDTIRSLTSILIQADKFGTSIGKTLRNYSETLRVQRRQQVEEQAAKTTVKLVFPLVLLIFPSLLLVTIGPSMIIMYEGFKQFLS